MEMTETTRRLNELWGSLMAEQDGWARQAFFPTCADGWLVGYTTERVHDGPPAIRGKFVAMAYKPVGKGARGGRKTAQSWERVYQRAFVQRKAARARAETMYRQHSQPR